MATKRELLEMVKPDKQVELYKALLGRFLSDNGRIWSTAAVFVPVALGAFGVFVSLKSPGWEHAALLGTASVGLLLFWNALADRHREFQDHEREWIAALEETWGLPEDGTWNAPKRAGLRAQALRLLLVIAVAIVWVVVALATASGFFSAQ